MPFAFTAAASCSASFQFVLPPSITMSPGWPKSVSWRMVSVVGAPEGTITHITRGFCSRRVTNSWSERAPTAPCPSWALIASSERS